MNALGPRHLVAVLATTTIFWLGCAQSTAVQTARAAGTPAPAPSAPEQPQVEPQQPQPQSPHAPREMPPQCKSDAECTGGQVCEGTLWAACDVCDGGKFIMICQSPRSCAEQKDCHGNRTCEGNVCK